MTFEKVDRQAIIVWLYTLKNTRNLQRYGHVHYISRKMRYAVIYVNQNDMIDIIEELESLHFVRSVERSYQTDIDLSFADVFSGEHVDYLARNSSLIKDHSLDEIVKKIRKERKQGNESN